MMPIRPWGPNDPASINDQLPFFGVKVGSAILIVMLVMMVMVMVAVFATPIIAVDPMMMMVVPMAWNPDHLPISIPEVRTMSVVCAVADLDVNVLGLKSWPETEGRHQQCNNQ
jgi:hypothetical protein